MSNRKIDAQYDIDDQLALANDKQDWLKEVNYRSEKEGFGTFTLSGRTLDAFHSGLTPEMFLVDEACREMCADINPTQDIIGRILNEE